VYSFELDEVEMSELVLEVSESCFLGPKRECRRGERECELLRLRERL
jgi:hypothetical protein